jgi:hypothetical protein
LILNELARLIAQNFIGFSCHDIKASVLVTGKKILESGIINLFCSKHEKVSPSDLMFKW